MSIELNEKIQTWTSLMLHSGTVSKLREARNVSIRYCQHHVTMEGLGDKRCEGVYQVFCRAQLYHEYIWHRGRIMSTQFNLA